jgi:hypothetical protein
VQLLKDNAVKRESVLLTRVKEHWPSGGAGPRVDRNGHLRMVYQLSDPLVEALIPRGLAEVPSELDLTIAVCADNSGQQWLSRWPTYESRNGFLMTVLGKYLEDGDGGRKSAADVPRCAALLALEILAVAGHSVSATSLFKAMDAYARCALADQDGYVSTEEIAAVKVRGVRDLQEEWAPLLRLSRAPGVADDDDGSSCSTRDRIYLGFKLDEVRELVVSSLLRTDAGKARFMCINRAMCEEALLEGTDAVRRLPADRIAGVSTLLPFLRAVFHGLMSLDPGRLDPRDHDKDSVRNISTLDSALPEDNYRRYAFLYQHIYRRVIESAPTWVLGRGFERDDIRLALLAIFANPGWARGVLRDMPESPVSERTLARFSAFGRVKDSRHKPPFEPEERHLFGAVGTDILSALYHAALRSAQDRKEVQVAEQIAGRIRLADGAAVQSPENMALASWRLGFHKITIDALQSEPNSKEAEKRCLQGLKSLGIELSADELRDCGAFLPSADWDKEGFESRIRGNYLEQLQAMELSKIAMEQASDLFFRLGEAMATEADFTEDRSSNATRERSLLRYAAAYAAYWLGDRIRSSSATSDLRSVEWPAVSAKATRYFIRTGLKMAKHLAHRASLSEEGIVKERLARSAAAFHLHALSRIDVYTRHLYRLPAERVQALLLLAAAARIESSMLKYLQNGSGWPRAVDEALALSQSYLEQARQHLLESDFVVPLLNRYLLERLKTTHRIAVWSQSGLSDIAHGAHMNLAWHDLAVLRRLSARSSYYKRILERLLVSRAEEPAITDAASAA